MLPVRAARAMNLLQRPWQTIHLPLVAQIPELLVANANRPCNDMAGFVQLAPGRGSWPTPSPATAPCRT
jgi:hypothetical protein